MVAVVAGNIKRMVNPRVWIGPALDPACDAILKQFRRMDICPADWPDDWKPHGARLVRRESTIHRLTSVSQRRSICVKIVNKGGRGDEEYAALSYYHARSDHELGYAVPEPYGWVPEHRALIMEWVDGRTYGQILRLDLLSARRRHANIRKVAGWLHWFHSQSEVEHGIPVYARQLKGIRKVFEDTDVSKAATAHDDDVRKFLEVAKQGTSLLRGNEISCVLLHGDFKPTNLIMTRSGVIYGIDFAGDRRGPVSHDICRFLSDLDLYKSLLGRSYALSPATGTNDFESFLTAYEERGTGIPRPVFVYLYFLTVLSVLVNQRKKFKGGLVPAMRLAVVRRLAGQLSRELSKEPVREAAVPVPARIAWCMRKIPIEWAIALWQCDTIYSILC